MPAEETPPASAFSGAAMPEAMPTRPWQGTNCETVKSCMKEIFTAPTDAST